MAIVATGTATTSTSVVLTLPAISGGRRKVLGVGWSSDADPSAALTLTIVTGSTTLGTYYIPKGGPGFIPLQQLGGCDGGLSASVVVTLSGTVANKSLNVHYE